MKFPDYETGKEYLEDNAELLFLLVVAVAISVVVAVFA